LFLLATVWIGVYTVANIVAPAMPAEPSRRVGDEAPLVETPPTVQLPTDTPTPPLATATRPQRIVTAVPPYTPEPAGSSEPTDKLEATPAE
jgi:hypothetical protein